MHVDAFFEYCLGHFHPYYTQIPRTSAPSNETRDGVPLEEDLALRALVPEWKPKRGRKRTDGKENSEEGPSKRPQLDTSDNTLHPAAHSVVFPHSAIPFSAFPDDMESNDPWMAAASSFGADSASDAATAQQGQEIRWRSLERDASPTAYPQSAVIPRRQRTSEVLPSTEPRSAVTPSSGEKPRSRRRHGPAVSSAWLSNSGSSNGKTRGRPPNKGTAAGPFSSFPAKPSGGQQPGQQSDAKSPPRIVLGNDTPYQQSPTPIAPANVKPSKLQLQVPQHPGGPVRLATPPRPPANGADDEGHLMMEGKNTNISSDPAAAAGNSPSRVSLASDEVIRILSTELLAGNLVGRSTPLSGDEARALASSVVTNLVDLYSKCSLGSPILMAALHLGQGHHFGFTRVAPDSITVIVSAGPPNMEGSALPGVDGSLGNATYTITYEYKHPSHISTRVTCGDIHIGGMGTETEAAAKLNSSNVKELDDTEDAEFEVDSEEEVSEATWKLRYMKLRTQLQKKERSLSQYKRKILESVMADI